MSVIGVYALSRSGAGCFVEHLLELKRVIRELKLLHWGGRCILLLTKSAVTCVWPL